MAQPTGLFLVTEDGQRIPVDTRLHHVADGCRYWEIIIEGDLSPIMPSVVAFDGPRVDNGEAIHFAEPGPGWDTAEWGEHVLSNSHHVFPGGYLYGDGSNGWIDA